MRRMRSTYIDINSEAEDILKYYATYVVIIIMVSFMAFLLCFDKYCFFFIQQIQSRYNYYYHSHEII